jgi:hypothetical protein
MLQKPGEKLKLEKIIDMAVCLKMIQQAIDNRDENVIRQCWVKSDLLPEPQQAKVKSNVDRPTSNSSLDENIDIELSSIVESLDLTKLGEGDISTSFYNELFCTEINSIMNFLALILNAFVMDSRCYYSQALEYGTKILYTKCYIDT